MGSGTSGQEGGGASQAGYTQSQESFFEGLSPDASDQSAEPEMEPREIEIHKGSTPLGNQ